VPVLWLNNRRADPGLPEAMDLDVPAAVRTPVRILGILLLVVSVAGFVAPPVLIGVWPWQLMPLTARVLAGWGGLLTVGNPTISGDRRWSSWVVGVESIALWHLLFLLRAPAVRQDFTAGSLVNGYAARARGILILMAGLYGTMKLRRRSGRRGVSPAA